MGIDLDKLEERLASAEEALKFYAHEDHIVGDYKYDEGFSVVSDEYSPLSVEDGLKARTHFEKWTLPTEKKK